QPITKLPDLRQTGIRTVTKGVETHSTRSEEVVFEQGVVRWLNRGGDESCSFVPDSDLWMKCNDDADENDQDDEV
ncbi:hypothetical protein M8C21_012607, partial [Ambrosia artemisiifolia]